MKPEYDEAAEILNKGADVSLSTFLSVCLQHAYLQAYVLHISESTEHTPSCVISRS